MSAEILVVEDERIVAQDLKEMLESMGYHVPALAYSAEEALEKAAWICPDLVLMDIRLDGEGDGVDAAVRIHRNLKLPIVYLTAHADDETLERAKEAEPYGYLVKPYAEIEVRSAVKMALHKVHGEKQLQRETRWHHAVLRSMADGVITTDLTGEVTFMNPAAEGLTVGKDLHGVFVDPETGQLDKWPLSELLRAITADSLDVGLRMAQGRDDVPVEYSAAPLTDQRGETAGSVLVLRDVSWRPVPEHLAHKVKSGARHPVPGVPGLLEAADRVAEEAYNYLSQLAGYDFWIQTLRRTADTPWEETEWCKQMLAAKHRLEDTVRALERRVETDGKQSKAEESRFATQLWQCCTDYIRTDERRAEVTARFVRGQIHRGEMEQAILAQGGAEQALLYALRKYREIRA